MLRKSLSRFIGALGLGFLVAVTASAAGSAQAKNDKQPNILLIMGDDIGWENLGAYHQGLLLDATPNSRQTGVGRHAIYGLLRGSWRC